MTMPLYPAMLSIPVLALSLAFLVILNRKRQGLHGHIHIASRDSLTGAYTRKAYFDLLDQEIARASRCGMPLSVLMVHCDDFKAIHERHGQFSGDQVLVDFAQKIKPLLRASDVFGRYGENEFSILLPDTPQADAYRVASRICLLLEQAAFPDLPRYTVSIGMVTMPHGECLGLQAFARKAEQALHQAKKPGNNPGVPYTGQDWNFA